MQRINGYEIYDYIVSGAKKIIDHEKILNAINVFPIADGDTGSNLSYTMKCILAKAQRHMAVCDTLRSISEVATEDSYGNSGTIFASYLYGMAEESAQKEVLSTVEFAEVAVNAVHYAYDSIATPVEGTILTVIKAWADFLITHHAHYGNRTLLFEKAVQHSKKILNKTKFQLSELREGNVVDAGAMGFVYFLEGILEFLEYGKVTHPSIAATPENVAIINHEMPNHRYCTEFLIERQTTFNSLTVKKQLSSIGDSVVILKTGEFTKVHCHTDTPAQAMDFLADNGKIIKAKIDDMAIEASIAHKRKHSIGIITDTIADMPEKWIEDEQIMRIPLQMILGGHVFIDRYTMTNEKLFQMMTNSETPPTSAQPGEAYIRKKLTYMLDHFDHVIGLFVSDQMSGLYEKVMTIANGLDTNRIHIINTKTNSATQGLMVHTALELIHKGKNVQEIIRRIEDTMNRNKIFVEIPDLYYATKSGRVPKAIGNITAMFGLKVVISIDDRGRGTVARERSLEKAIKKAMREKHIRKYAIVYSGDLDKALYYQALMETLTGKPPVFIEEVSTIVSAFVGKGSVGIGYEEE